MNGQVSSTQWLDRHQQTELGQQFPDSTAIARKKFQVKKAIPDSKRGHSVEYKTTGWKLSEDRKYLTLTDDFEIGRLKLIGTYDLHFYQIKDIKRIRLVKRADGYYAQLCIAIDRKIEEKPTTKAVGLDVGLTYFYTDSDGNKVDNPRFLRKSEKSLRRLQKRVSQKFNKGDAYWLKKKGEDSIQYLDWPTDKSGGFNLPPFSKNRLAQPQSNNYKKAKDKLARKHLKLSRQRKDFALKLAKCVIQSADLIAYEDLQVRNMVKNHKLAKSISDASWYQFRCWLEYFGNIYGKITIALAPQYTSINCSSCGREVKKTLSTRTHKCICGAELCRDQNAALNILAKSSSTVGHTGSKAWGQNATSV